MSLYDYLDDMDLEDVAEGSDLDYDYEDPIDLDDYYEDYGRFGHRADDEGFDFDNRYYD